MGQNRNVAKLNELKTRIPDDYVWTHGLASSVYSTGFNTTKQENYITISPRSLTYNNIEFDQLTGKPIPDGTVTIRGQLADFVSKLEQWINENTKVETK